MDTAKLKACPLQEDCPPQKERRSWKIGLALSGGGFRASIFHLGVIRRLEELGIMRNVSVLSTVSGGSIIGAYYACEMEQQLRNLTGEQQRDPETRIQLWADIATDFLAAVDQNLRTRALVYTPFYHPILFVKTLLLRAFRAGARAELIQEEYDGYFYHDNTLDQLPAVTREDVREDAKVLYGPKLVINTTSLLTGERVPFSREPVSGLGELSKVNKNVLPLSRVVGASSGVPVVFPPTSIAGNLLVDGGLSDNQGLEGLWGEECDVLLVSDASGQLEQLDQMSTGEISVYSRTNDILQHQIRQKLIEVLLEKWKAGLPASEACSSEGKALADGKKEDQDEAQEKQRIRFALVHLFRNLKDREDVKQRVSSEFIPALGRLRTDLDQFSYIEREALMYHGYTLIDAQLRQHCKGFLARIFGEADPKDNVYPSAKLPILHIAPLFRDKVQKDADRRERIRRDLLAGRQKLFLWRAMKKYPGRRIGRIRFGGAIHWTVGLFGALALGALTGTLWVTQAPLHVCKDWIERLIYGLMPQEVQQGSDWILTKLQMPTLSNVVSGVSGLAALLVLLALYLYVASFPAYVIVRRLTLRLDRRQYRQITGEEPGVKWDEPPAEGAESGSAVG